MKLAKLSLAAIMTVGAMSAVNAGSLEEAIKGVDLSGYARYRFDDSSASDHKNSYRVQLGFKTPVQENLMLNVRAVANGKHTKKETTSVSNAALTVDRLNLVFTPVEGLAATFGKGSLGHPQADLIATMVKTTYTLPVGLTLAAVYFDGVSNYAIDNGYAAGVIYSSDMIGARAWYANVDGFADTDNNAKALFAEVSGGVEMVTATLQYATVDAEAVADEAKTMRFMVEGNMDNFGLKAGYIANDKKNGDASLDGSDNGDNDLIVAGWKTSFTETDAKYLFLGANASFGKFGVSVDYVDVNDKDAAGAKEGAKNEIYGALSYKATKKLGTSIKYSRIDMVAAGVDDQNAFRFEAKYAF